MAFLSKYLLFNVLLQNPDGKSGENINHYCVKTYHNHISNFKIFFRNKRTY